MDIVTFKLHEQTRGFRDIIDITPLQVPVTIILADFDNRARTREIVVHFMGGSE